MKSLYLGTSIIFFYIYVPNFRFIEGMAPSFDFPNIKLMWRLTPNDAVKKN